MTDPADRFDRCAVQAGLRGDAMIGTAFPAARLLLVEQPGPWGRAGLLESRFNSAVAHRLVATLERRGIRVVAIRRPGRHVPAGPRRWAVADCRPDRERIVWGRYEDEHQLLDLDVAAVADAPANEAGAGADAEYLVCAHGTHDACCAIRGRPVAAALDALAPGHVWECSHVGGDRFAANVLVLPAGLLYGRVTPDQAAECVASTERGTVLIPCLRGRVGLSSAEQAAVALVHRVRRDAGWRDVRISSVDRSDPHRIVVHLSVRGGPMAVRVDVSMAEPGWLTCQSGSPGRAMVYRSTMISG